MLIRFRVSNFRSLRDEQELSMVAAFKDGREDLISGKPLGIDLLRVAGIYGANAAGKSNVIQALSFMMNAIKSSHREWPPSGPIPTKPFLLDKQFLEAPSKFALDFILSNVYYQYGFELDAENILSEWLYAHPNGRKQTWLKRIGQKFSFSKHLKGNNKAIERLTRKNSLFLSTAAQNNHQGLETIYSSLNNSVNYYDSANFFSRRLQSQWLLKADRQAGILPFLKQADLGIDGLSVREEAVESEVKEVASLLFKGLKFSDSAIEIPDTIPELELLHKSREGLTPLNYKDESEGTRTWFALLGPILRALEQGTTLCIDELASNLHPALAREAIRLFQSPATNPQNAQLLFTTHDTTLLGDLFDRPALHRDQIWFVEKDDHGVTHLYPLSDFKPRKLENIQRGYLQGRYGAIPFLGSFQVDQNG